MYATRDDDASATLRMARGPDVTQPMAALDARDGGDPHWVGALWTLPFVLRARALGSALALLLVKPRAFGRGWTNGLGHIPNPAVALATAISLQALMAEATNALLHREVAHTMLTSVRNSLLLYAQSAAMGILAHLILRILGSRRRLLTSIGVSFLVMAGWGTVAAAVRALLALAVAGRYGAGTVAKVAPPWVNAVVIGVLLVALIQGFVMSQLALAGAHGVARWKGFLAGTVGFVLVGVASSHLPQWMQYHDDLPELHAGVGNSDVSSR
jgi:hypothetical protein